MSKFFLFQSTLTYLFTEFCGIFSLENFETNVVMQANDQDKICHIHVAFLDSFSCGVDLRDLFKCLQRPKESDYVYDFRENNF